MWQTLRRHGKVNGKSRVSWSNEKIGTVGWEGRDWKAKHGRQDIGKQGRVHRAGSVAPQGKWPGNLRSSDPGDDPDFLPPFLLLVVVGRDV